MYRNYRVVFPWPGRLLLVVMVVQRVEVVVVVVVVVVHGAFLDCVFCGGMRCGLRFSCCRRGLAAEERVRQGGGGGGGPSRV
ncbi:hypothetical protein E2C01_045353 [Portunus trituberculatus]|uniref:Uncharacterized protein n=1 Tax=Portunus trituberculatus TaxID=210409 RepID=A0A5B7G119_PORTR|nr:hypothetical protein [Portunus trituberculatus]